MKWTLPILFTMLACGRLPYGQPSEVVVNTSDSLIQEAVQDFYTMSADYGIPAAAVRVDVAVPQDSKAIGSCQIATSRVRLHPKVLQDTRARYFVKYITFHELAHCAHGEGHTEDSGDLMHPRVWPTSLADQEARIGRYFRSRAGR